METGQEIINALGITLIHSLWQGAIIAALVLFMLIIVGKTNARARYAIHFTGLSTLLVAFIVTFVIILRNNQILTSLPDAILRVPPDNGIVQFLPLTTTGIAQKILGLLIPFSPYFAIFWISGFIITGIRFAGGAIVERISLTKGLVLPDSSLIELFNDIKRSMGLSSNIKLQISQCMISPLVTGVIAPLVIIPAAAVTGLNIEQIRSVMIHELAHIRRYDHILIFIQAIARLVLFFHPLTWYLMPEIDRERENCCDDFVIRNNNPINYIKALAMIQELNLPVTPANGLTGKSNQLLNRIKRLIKPETGYTATFRLSVILVFVITFATLFMSFIITDQPDVKSGRNAPSGEFQISSPQVNGTTTSVIGGDGDKKKMVIVFDNDTIKEMTVNGKKLSKEEMKKYASEIRKVQQELESTQDDLQRAHEELRMAHSELEKAHKEFDIANRDENFQFDFDFEVKDFNDLYQNHLNHPDRIKEMNLLNEKLKEMNLLNEMNKELNYEFHFDQLQKQMHSEEFQEKMKLAQEKAMKAFEKAQLKNKEFFSSQEFNEQMQKASEDARKAFEELSKSGVFDKEFNWQEPPSPRPAEDAEEAPVAPEPPEVPEVEFEMEHQEHPDIKKELDIENTVDPDNMETDEKPESNPKSKELENKLRELEID